MIAIGAVMATVLTLAPMPMVSASNSVEQTVSIAYVNPHFPTVNVRQADALTGDLNAERARYGLQPLQRDASLDRIAYAKAVDMAARGYFGHTDPDGITFYDRMREYKWPTDYVAENIAFDRSEPAANTAFNTSPPHHQNIVDPNERKVGIAVVTVGDGETFYVEDFSGQ
ncbi:MAG TPA: CAP domain-containing protein [Candidatus Baltobacteraceae bacterium]|nr:CAP domain-containing protein [Candidatus Baltobacteraceae bacterium]